MNRISSIAAPSVDDLKLQKDLIPLDGVKDVVSQYRIHAWELFQKLPMPDRSVPSWRRTDLRGLNLSELQLTSGSKESSEEIRLFDAKDSSGRISTTPESTMIELNNQLASQGMILSGLLKAEREHPDLLEQLGRVVPAEDGKIAALVNAYANFGALIHVPRGIQVSKPVLCDLSLNKAGKANFSHFLIHIEEGASVTLMLHFRSENKTTQQSLHAGNIEILLEKNSRLKFIQTQYFDSQVWNLSQERAWLAENAEMEWIFGVLGSQLTKTSTEVCLNGTGSSVKSSGFYFSALTRISIWRVEFSIKLLPQPAILTTRGFYSVKAARYGRG